MEDFMPATDEERAADIRAFYGLDEHVFDPSFLDENGLDTNGRHYVLSPGLLPKANSLENCATYFEYKVRNRLNTLSFSDPLKNAGPLEKEALKAAGLPLTEFSDGTWKINRNEAFPESRFFAEVGDQGSAMNVRRFYGLDEGSAAVFPKGRLPDDTVRMGATEFENQMRFHLNELTRWSRRAAGDEEAAALRAAGLPLIKRQDGKWNIDKKAALSESADSADKKNAESIMAFYGLDGKSPAVGDRGVLPSKYKGQGVSADEKSTRERLYNLTRLDRKGAGECETAALRAAGFIVTKNKKGGYSIDREATRKAYRDRSSSSQVVGLSQGVGDTSITASAGSSSYPVSASSWGTSAVQDSAGQTGGFGYPMNPVQAWPHQLIAQGYTRAGSSSQAGPSSYEVPPSHQQAGRQSKRGPKK
ncbi:hypothetical protein [Streptomyces sp. NPDC049744]|uniref:hypothetical protein n=1 Tax=Streptomyces sp. NPDC049744 TaxID=3154359 RepID=UPI00342FC88D